MLDKYIGHRLDILYIIYALQHPIYLIARPIIFILLKCIMLPCDPGTDLGDYNFLNVAISYDYIAY